jgi:plastocyanin domain-containing protein
MPLKYLLLTTLASLALSLTSGTSAQVDHGTMAPHPEPTGQFQRIDQPLWSRVAVASVGLGLIGLDLWWFVLSKPKG